jgi:hypothetical protein
VPQAASLCLGAKLAASWHRLPTEPYGDDERREYNRQIRAGTLCALIAGIVSVLVGVLAALVVSICQCCALRAKVRFVADYEAASDTLTPGLARKPRRS